MFPVPSCPIALQTRIQVILWIRIFYCKTLKKCLIQIYIHGDSQAPERTSRNSKLDHISFFLFGGLACIVQIYYSNIGTVLKRCEGVVIIFDRSNQYTPGSELVPGYRHRPFT
jgi:hypothetical protein